MTTFTIETKANGTLTADFALNDPNELNTTTTGDRASFTFDVSTSVFQTLQQYDTLAGAYRTTETLTGNLYYSETLSSSNIDSLAIGVEPSAELQNEDVTGVWTLIDNVTDARNQALSTTRVTLETTVIAPFTKYADHTELESARKL